MPALCPFWLELWGPWPALSAKKGCLFSELYGKLTSSNTSNTEIDTSIKNNNHTKSMTQGHL